VKESEEALFWASTIVAAGAVVTIVMLVIGIVREVSSALQGGH